VPGVADGPGRIPGGLTHYDVLGVAPDATADEVRAAYRARARALHPDRAGDAGAQAMALLNDAYRALRDPERRRAYDDELAGRVPATAPTTSGRTPAPTPTPPATSPPRGCGWVVALVMVVAVVGAIVAVVAAAAGRGSHGPDPVDGRVGVGSCVAVAADGSLREVGCEGPHDGTVVAVVARDQTCPPGTRTAASATAEDRLCVA
jgi:hypothetical protein